MRRNIAQWCRLEVSHLDCGKFGKLLVGERRKMYVSGAWGGRGLSLGVHCWGTDTRLRVGARSLVATLLGCLGTEIINITRTGVTVGEDVVRYTAGFPEGWGGWYYSAVLPEGCC